MDRESIISSVCESDAFRAESACLARGGYPVARQPRLYKLLENDLVRLIFPIQIEEINEGDIVALVCLYDLKKSTNVYAHSIFAGPTANASLRSLFIPPTQAKPQPGMDGNKAILKFISWKQAAWFQFLNSELEVGTQEASSVWIRNFWKALDRMYGGGNLLD